MAHSIHHLIQPSPHGRSPFLFAPIPSHFQCRKEALISNFPFPAKKEDETSFSFLLACLEGGKRVSLVELF